MTGIFKRLSTRLSNKQVKKAPVHKRLYSQGLTASELRGMFSRSKEMEEASDRDA